MAEKLSPWCKKAKIAMIQKDIGVSDMAERLGNNRSWWRYLRTLRRKVESSV